MTFTLHAGTVDITPDTSLPLFGRARRTLPSHCIVSRLEANCLLIASADEEGSSALITIDSLYPSQTLISSISKLCASHGFAIQPRDLMIVASHTHNAPALDDTKPMLGECSPDYVTFVAERIAGCLVTLFKNKAVPITPFSHGQAPAAGAVYRRRWILGFDFLKLRFSRRTVMAPNSTQNIANNLTMVILADDDENKRAVLWSWPCHAVSEPNAEAISADFPGAVRSHIRAHLGDPSLAVFYFPGLSGDIRPASLRHLSIHKIGAWIGLGSRFSKPTRKIAEALQANLFSALDRAYAESYTYDRNSEVIFTRRRRSLSLGDIRTEAGELTPITCDEWHIGPLKIKAVSAELAGDYVRYEDCGNPTTFLTGCAGQVFGYIPTDSQLLFGGYEVDGFASSFSIPGSFHGHIESRVFELIWA